MPQFAAWSSLTLKTRLLPDARLGRTSMGVLSTTRHRQFNAYEERLPNDHTAKLSRLLHLERPDNLFAPTCIASAGREEEFGHCRASSGRGARRDAHYDSAHQ